MRAQHAHAAERDVGGAALEVDELAEQGVSVLGGRVAALVEGEKGVLQRAVLRGQALLWHMQRRQSDWEVSIIISSRPRDLWNFEFTK